MESPDIIFWSLTFAGLLLIGVEVVVPGGILGVLGFIALIGAAITSFYAFGPTGGLFATALLMIGTVSFLVGWLYILPRTKTGNTLTLKADASDWSAAKDEKQLLGMEGEALSNLIPSGTAMLGNRRTDVIADSSFVDKGAQVKVVEVSGNRVVVRQVG